MTIQIIGGIIGAGVLVYLARSLYKAYKIDKAKREQG